MQGVNRTLVNPSFTLAEYEAEKAATRERDRAATAAKGLLKDIRYEAKIQRENGTITQSVTVRARGINEGFLNALAEVYDRISDNEEIVSLTFWQVN